MFRIIQVIGVVFFGSLFYLLDAVSDTYAMMLCLGLILLFGVPHGAVDHKIHQSTTQDKNLVRYILTYLVIAVGYVLWWLLDPAKALFIFIILSAYHFGQEFLEDRKVQPVFNPLLDAILWGAAILILPLLFSLEEVNPYIEVVAGRAISFDSNLVVQSAIVVIVSLVIGYLAILWVRNRTSGRNILEMTFFICITLGLHLLLDFIIAFSVYFVFFHSLNAFRHQFRWLASRKKQYAMPQFLRDLLLFGAIAVVGIIAIIYVANPTNTERIISLFFILISLITLPHAITLDHFYKVRKLKNLPSR